MKLVKDPKIEKITIENYIHTGSVIKQASWVLGLVIYTGKETKISKNIAINNFKFSKFSIIKNFYSIISMVLIIIFAIISITISNNNHENLEIIGIINPKIESGLRFISYIILFCPFTPFNLYIIIDLIYLINKILIEKKLRKIDPEFSSVNSSSLDNLGETEYVLIDKTGTMTTSNYLIEAILTPSKQYEKNSSKKFKFEENDNNQILLNFTDTQKFQTESNLITEQNNNPLNLNNVSSEMIEFNDIEEFTNRDNEEIKNKNIIEGVGGNFNHSEYMRLKENFLDIGLIEKEKPDIEKLILEKKNEKENIKFKEPELWVENEENQKSKSELERNISRSETTNYFSSFNYNNTMLSISTSFGGFEDFSKDLKNNEDTCHQILTAMVLCHNATTSYGNEKELIISSLQIGDESILKFCNDHNYTITRNILNKDCNEVTINFNGNKEEYSILAINDFSETRKRFSIFIKNKSEESYLICRGNFDSMRNNLMLSDSDQEKLNSISTEMEKNGFKLLVYAKRCLKVAEMDDFIQKYEAFKFSLRPQKQELENLAIEAEQKLVFIGLLGIKEEIDPLAISMVENFKEMGCKPWLVSGDSYPNVACCALNSGFIKDLDQTYKIIEANKDDLYLKIRSILSDFKTIIKAKSTSEGKNEFLDGSPQNSADVADVPGRFVKKRKKRKNASLIMRRIETNFFNHLTPDTSQTFESLSIIISGTSLKIILNDDYLRNHFIYIISLCSNLICFNMNPELKASLVKIAQSNFINSPKVLAIGDGLNDNMMMDVADFSIGVQKGKTKFYLRSDVYVSKLSVIRDLILFEGKYHNKRLNSVLSLAFAHSIMMGFVIFLFDAINFSTIANIFPSSFIFFYMCIVTLPSMLYFGISDRFVEKIVINIYPAFFLEGKSGFWITWLKIFIQGIIEPLLISLIIFVLTINALPRSFTELGNPVDYSIYSITLFVSLIFIEISKILQTYSNPYKIGVFIDFIGSIFIFILFTIMYDNTNESDISFKLALKYIPQHLIVSLVIVSNIWIPNFIYFIMRNVVYPYLPLFKPLENTFIEKKINLNSELLNILKKPRNLANIVKRIFNRNEEIDILIQETLNTQDIQNYDFKINPLTLNFQESHIQLNFKQASVKYSLLYARILLTFYFLTFFIFAIVFSTKYIDSENGFTKLGVSIGYLLIMVILFNKNIESHYQIFMNIFLIMIFGFRILMEWTGEINFNHSIGLMIVFFIINTSCFNQNAILVLTLSIVNVISFVIRIISYCQNENLIKIDGMSLQNCQTYLLPSSILISVHLLGLTFFGFYKVEYLVRKEHLSSLQKDKRNSVRQDILTILVPNFVKDLLNSDLKSTKFMQEEQKEVSILFCDICDFDDIIKEEGLKVVEMLDKLFRIFDSFCLTHGIQKIETVGKTYMAAAGISACESEISPNLLSIEKTRRVLNMAFDMMEEVKKIKYGNGKNINLKIGIHVGKCIAGVIGYHKPQFSLIGDTVNTTSRVCSTGSKGALTISQPAFKYLKSVNAYFKKRNVEAKGKGILTTYQVTQNPPDTKNKVLQGKFKNAVRKINQSVAKTGPKKKILDMLGLSTASNTNELLRNFSVLVLDRLQEQRRSIVSLDHGIKRPNRRQSIENLKTIELDNSENEGVVAYDKILLKFTRIPLSFMRNFQKENAKSNFVKAFVIIFSFSILILVDSILMIQNEELYSETTIIFVLRIIFVAGNFASLPLLNQIYSKQKFKYGLMLLINYGTLIILISNLFIVNSISFALIHQAELIVCVIVTNNITLFFFIIQGIQVC